MEAVRRKRLRNGQNRFNFPLFPVKQYLPSPGVSPPTLKISERNTKNCSAPVSKQNTFNLFVKVSENLPVLSIQVVTIANLWAL